MTITLDIPPDLEQPLRQEARLQGKELSAFLLDCVKMRLRSDTLPDEEAKLILAIFTPLPPEVRKERDALLKRQRRRLLTDAERNRFSELSEQIENDDAARVRHIGELGRLRGLSLPEMAAQLPLPIR